MHWRRDEFEISDAAERLDLERLCRLLNGTYWAADRSRETIETCVRHSINFGLYRGRELIGYGRVVTDYATHGYLADVVIEEAYRGRGLGTWLLECVLAHPDLRTTRLDLVTRDAQEFYRRRGFGPHQYEFLVRYPPDYAG